MVRREKGGVRNRIEKGKNIESRTKEQNKEGKKRERRTKE